jgi:hypothetical protein
MSNLPQKREGLHGQPFEDRPLIEIGHLKRATQQGTPRLIFDEALKVDGK